MNLQPTTTEYAAPKEILASDHFVVLPGGIHIDAAKVAAVNGVKKIPVGTYMGKVTASGKYGPYDKDAVDGLGTSVGILMYDVDVTGGDDTGSLLIHGVVKTATLPVAPTAAVIAELNGILFV